jgi:hypothetical protein
MRYELFTATGRNGALISQGVTARKLADARSDAQSIANRDGVIVFVERESQQGFIRVDTIRPEAQEISR